MRIWIDLANSPHVPFFRALIPEFEASGHTVTLTARDFAQTVELARQAGLSVEVIGEHGGREISGKAANLFGRARQLWRWARQHKFQLAVSHNSYSQISAARALGIRTVTLMDYEHQPANHLAFRLASRIIIPDSFPAESLKRYGARTSKVRRYSGIKEDVYLSDFQPDPEFHQVLAAMGISKVETLVVVRPPASDALYHRFENELFGELMRLLASQANLRVILIPRTNKLIDDYVRPEYLNFVVLEKPVDGSNLIFAADLVVSAGGTMNREAAALGVPAATVYAGKWAAIDEMLVNEGRLIRIASKLDLRRLEFRKRPLTSPRLRSGVRRQVADLILNEC